MRERPRFALAAPLKQGLGLQFDLAQGRVLRSVHYALPAGYGGHLVACPRDGRNLALDALTSNARVALRLTVIDEHLYRMRCRCVACPKLWCRKELGHVLLHAPPENALSTESAADATLHRGIAEVEAESVALMVGAAHGLDTSSYTVPYVSSWAASVPGKNPVEVVQATAERVRATALGILDKVDTQQVGDGNPPGLDREALTRRRGTAAVTTTARRDGAVLGL